VGERRAQFRGGRTSLACEVEVEGLLVAGDQKALHLQQKEDTRIRQPCSAADSAPIVWLLSINVLQVLWVLNAPNIRQHHALP
jgi:hypothetical protein